MHSLSHCQHAFGQSISRVPNWERRLRRPRATPSHGAHSVLARADEIHAMAATLGARHCGLVHRGHSSAAVDKISNLVPTSYPISPMSAPMLVARVGAVNPNMPRCFVVALNRPDRAGAGA
jgi:hypothetical protein